MRMTKRTFLGGAGAAAIAAVGAVLLGRGSEASAETFELNLTPEQWRRRLSALRIRCIKRCIVDHNQERIKDQTYDYGI